MAPLPAGSLIRKTLKPAHAPPSLPAPPPAPTVWVAPSDALCGLTTPSMAAAEAAGKTSDAKEPDKSERSACRGRAPGYAVRRPGDNEENTLPSPWILLAVGARPLSLTPCRPGLKLMDDRFGLAGKTSRTTELVAPTAALVAMAAEASSSCGPRANCASLLVCVRSVWEPSAATLATCAFGRPPDPCGAWGNTGMWALLRRCRTRTARSAGGRPPPPPPPSVRVRADAGSVTMDVAAS